MDLYLLMSFSKHLQFFTDLFHILHVSTLHGPLPFDEFFRANADADFVISYRDYNGTDSCSGFRRSVVITIGLQLAKFNNCAWGVCYR
ncbi:hypothetical protein DPMN_093740 [Dreissena polymorpha]|uniref:Uncharacterized protein n=1 Tax=Dreissena polymorpha TaxID=45954 RepID=A0A9D4L4F2_DREPO|nr:hypothetical protein DPMN_093740 [Dreissena polymorpha]